MALAIVSAEPRHLDALEALEKQCFSVPWTREQLAASLPDEHHVFLVAERDGKAVGYVGMTYVLDEGYIGNVAVTPDCRRQGVGSALIAALLEQAGVLALSFVTLEVRPSNTPAVALYGGFGFEPVGRRKNYYDSPKEDALLMTRQMKNEE